MHRNLQTAMDLVKSKVTVSSASVYTNSEVVITATAFSAANVRITTGGEKLFVEVHNECALDALKLCNELQSSTKSLNKTATLALTDHSNGTYSARYVTGTIEGKITFVVYKERDTGVPVYGYVYSNPNWTGVPVTSKTMSQFKIFKTNVALTGKTAGTFSTKQVCYYKKPSDFTTTLYVNATNCGNFYIDDAPVVENM